MKIKEACGAAGAKIVDMVHEGDGTARVPLYLLREAMCNQAGVEAVLDHFALSEEASGKPLILLLVEEFSGR